MNVARRINQECTHEWLTIETGSTPKRASETWSWLSFVGCVQLFLWHILLCGHPLSSCWLSLWSCIKYLQAWSSLGLEIGLAYSQTGTDLIHVTVVCSGSSLSERQLPLSICNILTLFFSMATCLGPSFYTQAKCLSPNNHLPASKTSYNWNLAHPFAVCSQSPIYP